MLPAADNKVLLVVNVDPQILGLVGAQADVASKLGHGKRNQDAWFVRSRLIQRSPRSTK